MPSLDPLELKRRLDAGEKLRLIDVREAPEWSLCRLPGAEHYPMSRVQLWQAELAPEGGPYVLYCHHGMRSARLCQYFAQLGRTDVFDLAGGIDRWSQLVDPAVARY
ncbi:MAG: sulfurtransferase [Planctomycetota bacterium]|nr:MAG: sulfurtransferase [Planctomycetota bacterium]